MASAQSFATHLKDVGKITIEEQISLKTRKLTIEDQIAKSLPGITPRMFAPRFGAHITELLLPDILSTNLNRF